MTATDLANQLVARHGERAAVYARARIRRAGRPDTRARYAAALAVLEASAALQMAMRNGLSRAARLREEG